MSDKFRMDGTSYPSTMEGLMEWAKDFGRSNRVIGQTSLWNGLWVSTVWLGVDHNYRRFLYPELPPLIFETMVFCEDVLPDCFMQCLDEMKRYSTIDEAADGHRLMIKKCSSLWFTLKLFVKAVCFSMDGEAWVN